MQMSSSSLMLNEETVTLTPAQVVQQWLVNQLSEQLSLEADTINVTEPLTRYGLDSIDAVTLVGDLEDWLDLDLPDTLFWDHPTIEKSAQFLAENFDLAEALNTSTVKEEKPAPQPAEKKAGGGFWSRLAGK